MKPFPAPTRPGFWWAKLRHPSRMPEGEDWASPDFEPVEVIDNNGDGDEALGVFVPGIQPMQWVPDFVWGPEIPALADDPPGRAEHMSLTLPIAMDGRQWWVGQAAGDTFRTDGDFHGTALTIEIRTDDEARAVAAALVDQTEIRAAHPVSLMGRSFRIEHDGFEGEVIGSYVTKEGKRGVVLQQHGTRVVHVYGEKWLKGDNDT